MSDVMLFGVLRMPYGMAMNDELSRQQFYDRAQQAADALGQAQAKIKRLEEQHEYTGTQACLDRVEALENQLDVDVQLSVSRYKRIEQLEAALRRLHSLPVNDDTDSLMGFAGAVRMIAHEMLGSTGDQGND